MNEVRAFVGHSYTDGDAEVVRKFIECFIEMQKMNSLFSWQNAKSAEPRGVSEKVIQYMSNNDVFIAICTRKERVIHNASLQKPLWPRGFLKAKEEVIAWKTSDWIIQEIGLAIGMGLKTILLIERGIRAPGDLQADLNYIEFDRESPEKSFVEISQMITSLLPKASESSVTSPDISSAQSAEKKEPEPPADDKWKTPTPEWKRPKYERAFWIAVMFEDTDAINAIGKAYLQSQDAAQGDNRDSWKAFGESVRLTSDKGGSLATLEAFAIAHPDSPKILMYWAEGLEKFQEFAKAAETYEAAAGKATDKAENFRLLGRAAVKYAQAGTPASASEIIGRMKVQVETSGEGELQLLRELLEVAKIAKANESALAVMERIIEISPGDTDTRFSLAYAHSQNGNNDLALYHYLRIPRDKRSSTTWNNLGVAFDKFSLPVKSVDAYRKAEDLGGTLAMSNLANRLTSAGFLLEAIELCNKALAIKEYDENVGRSLVRLKELPQEENKKKTELLEKTKPKSDFYREFGRAISLSEPKEFAERWEGPDCVLTARLFGSAFSAEGSYDQQSHGLLGYLISGSRSATSGQNAPIRFRVAYNGTLRGRAIEAHIARTREGESPKASTLLGSTNNETKVLMVLTDDGDEIKVMENPQEDSPKFYTLRRQAAEA